MSVTSYIECFIAELVIADHVAPPLVVERAVAAFPRAPADLMVISLASVACELQELYSERSAESVRYGYRLYKVAAVLACDIAALRASGIAQPTCADLSSFWKTVQAGRFLPPSVAP